MKEMTNKINLKFWNGFRIWIIRDADGKPLRFYGTNVKNEKIRNNMPKL